jgi:hypothetical protein
LIFSVVMPATAGIQKSLDGDERGKVAPFVSPRDCWIVPRIPVLRMRP